MAGEGLGVPLDPTRPVDDDWRAVVDALGALGESITRASHGSTDDVENRRRLRDLADGLAALARQVGDAASAPSAPATEVSVACEPSVPSLSAYDAVGVPVSDELRPKVLSALRAANEKFKQGGVPAGATAAMAPLPSTIPSPIAAWLRAQPAAETVPTPSAQMSIDSFLEPVAEAAPDEPVGPPAVPVDRLVAVKATHERFVEERHAAEAVAAARAQAAESLMAPLAPESVSHEPQPEEPAAELPAAPEPETEPAPEPTPVSPEEPPKGDVE